jgi:hypothetical protein
MADDRIEKLKAKLHGTRERAPGTIAYYLQTAERFILDVPGPSFASSDIDAYIARRRAAGIGERTLTKEFWALKALATANGVVWNFSRQDRPRATEPPKKTYLKPTQIDQLIIAQAKFTKSERFYLAVSTTWACRREAMAQIKKRDYDVETFLIRGVHLGQPVKHRIPEVLKPIFAEWPGEHTIKGLSDMFWNICRKAELELPTGYGWHSIRRTLTSIFANILPRNHMAPSLWAEYTGWSRQAKGRQFMDSAMMGEYADTNAASEDPFEVDTMIYSVHPFLKTWLAATASNFLRPLATFTPGLDKVEPSTAAALVELAEKASEQIKVVSPLDERINALRRALQK